MKPHSAVFDGVFVSVTWLAIKNNDEEVRLLYC